MRILHLIFSSRLAGSERYCADLANRQAADGHDVHVAGTLGSPLAAVLSAQVTFHGFNAFFRGMRLNRLLDEVSPDVCHGHLSAACKALGSAPWRHHTVATLHVGYKAHQHDQLDGLICVNRTQQSHLSGYRGMTRSIPNWLPLSTKESSAPGLREELGLGDDVFLIGAVGRLHVSKGMDVLISAFKASAPARAALVIVGEGPQREELEQLSAGDPRIHLVGFRPIVGDCLRDLDLFVSPSREESFGLAIIEAMSAGLPVIATATDGPTEYLSDQPITLVPSHSVDALAASLTDAYRRFSLEGLPRIGYDLSQFEPAARLGNITDFYASVIAAKQRSAVKAGAMAVAT